MERPPVLRRLSSTVERRLPALGRLRATIRRHRWLRRGLSTVAARYKHGSGNTAGGQIEYRVPNRNGRPRNVVRPYSEKEYASGDPE